MSRIIDIHTHAWPEGVADKAVASLSDSGVMSAFYDGTVPGLLADMERCGVDISVVQPVATKPGQVRSINDWSARAGSDRVVCFGAMHPEAENPAEEIARMASLGIQGFKLHPEHQEFAPDEPRMEPIYDAALAHKMTLLFHAGRDEFHDTLRGTPESFAAVLDAYPGLRIVLAHFGGYQMWGEVSDVLVGREVYFDTAYTLGHLPDDDFVEIVHAHGPERILFGSDGPWTDAAAEIAWIRSLALRGGAADSILGDNAARLLGRM
ncbi:MAG: amidohydrolase family protein [Coriobacteriia bacterium]|nr:amidohydrolase family protein [Coriobacteriia bacterium]